MPTLTIRNLAPEVRDTLRQRAAKKGRSMEAEAREILTREARLHQRHPGEIARQIHEQFKAIGGAEDLVLPERTPPAAPISFDE